MYTINPVFFSFCMARPDETSHCSHCSAAGDSAASLPAHIKAQARAAFRQHVKPPSAPTLLAQSGNKKTVTLTPRVHINVSPHEALAAQQVAEKELGERTATICFVEIFIIMWLPAIDAPS